MKNKSSIFIFAGLLPFLNLSAQEQEKDSVATENLNSAIFMNAASDGKPREISLGLPTNNSSAVPIFEDGLPVSYYIYQFFPFKSWHGGASAESTGTLEPMETAMRYGEINNYVNSFNRGGSERFRGTAAYSIGSHGQQKFDFNISGPIRNGWGYSLSTYQNFDPGSNHTVSPNFKDRHQFYKGVLSKDFNDGRGRMTLVYQHVNYMTMQESYGPFIFVGDGSVDQFMDFELGKDSYWPELSSYSFMDFKTGKMKSAKIDDGNRDITHHATFTLDYDLSSNTHLNVRSRFKTGTSERGSSTLGGIEHAEAGSTNYTYSDGTAFIGDLQRRSLLCYDLIGSSWLNNAEIQHRINNHSLRFGLDYAYDYQNVTVSSVNFSHEVKANPDILLFKGDMFYNFNTSGEYYKGKENKVAAYIKDEWDIRRGTSLAGFVRVEYQNLHGHSANNKNGYTGNTRYPGFNLTKGKITSFNENFLNGAAGLDLTYRIVGGLSFKAQGIVTRVNRNTFSYGGFFDPPTTPTDTKFAKAGLSYVNSWLNIVSQLVFINQSDINSRTTFQHALQKETEGYPIGYIESKMQPINYDIESLGWTTDAMLTPFKGFSMHVQLTIRNPQYKNYGFTPTFSDGVTEKYDFSGNNVTNLHKTEISLDPSYSFKQWRIWLTARYISKQYINKTNSLYYNGRWETFAGVDYKLTPKCRLSLNVINWLNQTGASGSIGSADLVEDASGYKNYLMAGTFIRPFTVEFGVNVDF